MSREEGASGWLLGGGGGSGSPQTKHCHSAPHFGPRSSTWFKIGTRKRLAKPAHCRLHLPLDSPRRIERLLGIAWIDVSVRVPQGLLYKVIIRHCSSKTMKQVVTIGVSHHRALSVRLLISRPPTGSRDLAESALTLVLLAIPPRDRLYVHWLGLHRLCC